LLDAVSDIPRQLVGTGYPPSTGPTDEASARRAPAPAGEASRPVSPLTAIGASLPPRSLLPDHVLPVAHVLDEAARAQTSRESAAETPGSPAPEVRLPGQGATASANAEMPLPGEAATAAAEGALPAGSADEGDESAPPGSPEAELTDEEKQEVDKLKKRDREVRQHEQAHLAAAGGYARGGPTYEYTTGPDNKRYAVGGEVSIDTSKEKEPEATIRKAQVIYRAALAPAEPSSQDRRVASEAKQMESEARQELAEQRREEATETEQTGQADATAAGESAAGDSETGGSEAGGSEAGGSEAAGPEAGGAASAASGSSTGSQTDGSVAALAPAGGLPDAGPPETPSGGITAGSASDVGGAPDAEIPTIIDNAGLAPTAPFSGRLLDVVG
jgi:hypothetical protein